jgi:inosine-uridine nucleoside N-ribohydrolase
MLVHLDTDFDGDTDDACALAYLLGSPDVQLAGTPTPTCARSATGPSCAARCRPST